MSVVVDESTLGERERLGKGGMAVIYRLTDFRISGMSESLVYKKYKKSVLPVPSHGLEQIAAVRERMHPDQRLLFDERTAWPVRVVESEGQAVGVLMRLIPDDFFQTLRMRDGSSERVAREISFAMRGASEYTRRVGVEVPTVEQRVVLMRDFARILAMLHFEKLVYGDISARNLLYTLHPRPRVLLVDCDAVRVQGSSSPFGTQPHSPHWQPPESLAAQTRVRRLKASGVTSELAAHRARQFVQNVSTDRYKFGLTVLRVLSAGEGAHQLRDISPELRRSVGAPLIDQLVAALADDPNDRPTIKSWFQLLRSGGGAPRSQGPTAGSNGVRATPGAVSGPSISPKAPSGTAQSFSRLRVGAFERQPDGSWRRVG